MSSCHVCGYEKRNVVEVRCFLPGDADPYAANPRADVLPPWHNICRECGEKSTWGRPPIKKYNLTYVTGGPRTILYTIEQVWGPENLKPEIAARVFGPSPDQAAPPMHSAPPSSSPQHSPLPVSLCHVCKEQCPVDVNIYIC